MAQSQAAAPYPLAARRSAPIRRPRALPAAHRLRAQPRRFPEAWVEPTPIRPRDPSQAGKVSPLEGCPGSLGPIPAPTRVLPAARPPRSEEHTSELQSLMRISYAVFCLKTKIITVNEKSNLKHTTIRQD